MAYTSPAILGGDTIKTKAMLKGEQRYGVISVYATRGGLWESQVRSDAW